jgi:hypothetical protein
VLEQEHLSRRIAELGPLALDREGGAAVAVHVLGAVVGSERVAKGPLGEGGQRLGIPGGGGAEREAGQ